MESVEHYDFIIIGGGIFGAYTALYLQQQSDRVLIIDKEEALFKKASIVNQARLHSGYHYPRSIGTARMSDENKLRFWREHSAFINDRFTKYYGIERYGSFTDALQFERFCGHLGIRCERVMDHPLFNYEQLEAVYRTDEYTFDPMLIGQYYKNRLAEKAPRITSRTGERVENALSENGNWVVETYRKHDGQYRKYRAPVVVNATYAGTNTINRSFGIEELGLMHEISEMAFVYNEALKGIGLTIMDGHYGSLMPYGYSGLLSLSSVSYTHHKVSYQNEPEFDCMAQRSDCSPQNIAICNRCRYRPRSNYRKMESQMLRYLAEGLRLNYLFSMFTVKTKLKASYIDDARPTVIDRLHQKPDFYCLFAGKINSIYEIEKLPLI